VSWNLEPVRPELRPLPASLSLTRSKCKRGTNGGAEKKAIMRFSNGLQ
jgi:hypothetical protein